MPKEPSIWSILWRATPKKAKRRINESFADLLPCGHCGEPLSTAMSKFCQGCGQENPNFSLEQFEAQWNESYEDVLKHCTDGNEHEEVVKRFHELKFEYVYNYCTTCGAKLNVEEKQ